MRVSVDVSAVPARPAGAGRYSVELVRALARNNGSEVQLVLTARTDDESRWHALAPAAEVLAVAPTARPLRLLWEQSRLPGLLKRSQPPVSLHHGLHYTMPERAHLPRVVTVHDMTLFDHPEWHERSKVLLFRRAIDVACRRADALIAVSEHTAERLRDRYSGLPPVHVVAHGVDHERFRPASDVEEHADLTMLASIGVRPPYVAFVGTLEPRKDVPRLVAAFDRLAPAHPGLQLVLAGRPEWGARAVDRAIGAARHADRIVRPGFLVDEAVPALFRRAAVVGYPSLVEGFGLPALEALACGAPLVTTTGSAMEEVVGDAGLLVPPADTDALTDAVAELLETPLTVERLGRAGPLVAAPYTWAACADAHAALYAEVAG